LLYSTSRNGDVEGWPGQHLLCSKSFDHLKSEHFLKAFGTSRLALIVGVKSCVQDVRGQELLSLQKHMRTNTLLSGVAAACIICSYTLSFISCARIWNVRSVT
jgi:hypothetical protein